MEKSAVPLSAAAEMGSSETVKEASVDQVQQGRSITEIVKYLVENYGTDLDLPSWQEKEFSRKFSVRTGISIGTVRSIIEGKSDSIKTKTSDRLSDVFRDVIPHIDSSWFRNLSLQNFVAQLNERPRQKKIIQFTIPLVGYANLERLNQWLCGTYVCYRYSFEQGEQRLVAREILDVWERNASFFFQMSFVPGGDEVDQNVLKFDGVILPLGESVFFVGWNDRRGRSLFIHRDFATESENCRIGILSSTRLDNNRAPLAACMVLIKCQYLPMEIRRFMVDATTTLPFEAMIDADFGKSDREWLGKFLNNSPHGPGEDDHSIPDAVLRLNLFRFTAEMPRIYRAAMSNPSLNAPFKPDWTLQPDGSQIAIGVEKSGGHRI